MKIGVQVGATLASSYNSVFRTAAKKTAVLQEQLAKSQGMAQTGKALKAQKTAISELITRQREFGDVSEDALKRARDQYRATVKQAREYGMTLAELKEKQSAFEQQASRTAAILGRQGLRQRNKDVRAEMHSQALPIAGAVMAMAVPVNRAMEFGHQLRAAGNITAMTAAQVDKTRKSMTQLAGATNQYRSNLLEGYSTLTGKGMEDGAAKALLTPIGKAATATQAAINDLSVTAYSAMDNLKVPVAQIGRTLDILTQSGKEGSFELKDMAQYFPSLTASAKALGVEGIEGVASLGAALQVAMKGAGDPSEAANNFRNFLSKATSPETVKRFQMLGVDIKQVLNQGISQGRNPIEVFLDQIQRSTGGDQFKMGELFGDMQVLNFLKPMLANMDEYKRIKQSALQAQGVVDKDFANMMGTASEKAKAAKIALEGASDAIAKHLVPVVGQGAVLFAGLTSRIGAFAEANPMVTRSVISAAAGLLAFRVGAFAFRYGATVVSDASIMLRSGFVKARTAFLGLNTAMLANPMTWIVAGIAGAGFLIWKYWEPLKAFFTNFWNGIEAGWNRIKPMFPEIAGVVNTVTNAFSTLTGPGGVLGQYTGDTTAAAQAGAQWGDSVGSKLQSILTITQSAVQTIGIVYTGLETIFVGAGEAIGSTVFEIVQFVTTVQEQWTALSDFIKSIDIGQIIKNMFSGPLNFVSNGLGKIGAALGLSGDSSEPAPANVPKMAMGGLVVRPTLALVGEAGQEAVVPLTNKSRGLQMLGVAAQHLGVAGFGGLSMDTSGPRQMSLPSLPDLPSMSAKPRGGDGINIVINVTVNGQDAAQAAPAVRQAVVDGVADLESKLAAIRQQQERLSFG